GIGSVGAVRLGAKAVQGGQLAGGGDFKDCALLMAPACRRRAVEVSVAGLDYRCVRVGPVRALLLRTEAVQRGQRACGGDLEDGALSVRSAVVGGSVEFPIGRLHQSQIRM